MGNVIRQRRDAAATAVRIGLAAVLILAAAYFVSLYLLAAK